MKYLRKFIYDELNSMHLITQIVESKLGTIEYCIKETKYKQDKKDKFTDKLTIVNHNSKDIIQAINNILQTIEENSGF